MPRRPVRSFRVGFASLSLALCAATAALWVRSYWHQDQLRRATEGGLFWQFHSDVGYVTLDAAWRWPEREALSYAVTEPERYFGVFLFNGWRTSTNHIWKFAGMAAGVRYGTAQVMTSNGRAIHQDAPSQFESARLADASFERPFASVAVPHWVVCVLLTLPMLVVGATRLAATFEPRARFSPTRCTRCGYDLRATPDRCPECGTPATRPPDPPGGVV